MTPCRPEELLIHVIAGLLDGLSHVAVGAASPVPGAGALLASHRSAGALRVSVLGSRTHSAFTDGSGELFDCAAQGRIDAFFLGGAQIDGEGSINLVAIGEHAAPKVRFPGSFGSAFLYHVVPRVILFTLEHSRRVLVPRVDFVSAAGPARGAGQRRGGPVALLTNRCLFDFDPASGGFRLRSVHPGHSVEEVAEHTGFDYQCADPVTVTAPPDAADLALIRGPVAEAIAEVYPAFARSVLSGEAA